MTNTQMLINSLDKANQEKMIIVKSGNPTESAFAVINNDNAYMVTIENKKIISCTCPHHVYRNAVCKHMIKVSLVKNIDIVNI